MEHGTNSRYVNMKCRCDECKEAHREYAQAQRKQMRALQLDPVIAYAMHTLGGKCAHCGCNDEVDNRLAFCAILPEDIIDGQEGSIRSMIYHRASWFAIADRLRKTELVCLWCRQKRGPRVDKR